jgi:hypothetical protein
LNREVNFCLREVLELEEKVEEEEDLGLEVIVVIRVCGRVVVMGGCSVTRRERKVGWGGSERW